MKRLLFFTVGFLTVFVLGLLLYGCVGPQVRKPPGCAGMLADALVDMAVKGENSRSIDQDCALPQGILTRHRIFIEVFTNASGVECTRISGEVDFYDSTPSVSLDKTFCD